MRLNITVIATAGILLLGAGRASATTFGLYEGEDVPGPCGTIVERQTESNIVEVLAALNPGDGLGASGGGDSDFDWSPSGNPELTFGGNVMGSVPGTGNVTGVDDGSGEASTGAVGEPGTSSADVETFLSQFNCAACGNGFNPSSNFEPLQLPNGLLDATPGLLVAGSGDDVHGPFVGENLNSLDITSPDSPNGDSWTTGLGSANAPAANEEITAAPEPVTILLLGTGLLVTAARIRRRRA